jgi:NTP pyrophosphatase (non-canonical NTP hydrolase)
MIYNKILKWAKVRGILDSGDPKTQLIKLVEEQGELAEAILKNNKEEVKDAVGDMIVVLTNLSYFYDLTIPECVESAYNEIKNRKGKIINNTFVKDENSK